MRKGYMKVPKRWRRSPNNCVGFGLSGSSPTTLGESITKPVEKMAKEVLYLLEISSFVTLACAYFHITTDEAALHQAEIVRDIVALFV